VPATPTPVHFGGTTRRDDGRPPLVQRHTVCDSWAINTYVTCDVRCTYCITVAQGVSTPRYPASHVAAKLRSELDAIGRLDRLVVGAYCDVYPSPEARLQVTRRALEVLAERDLGFRLVTKGTTVVRDAALFAHSHTLVQISVCALDDEWRSRFEPGAPSADARLAALHELAAMGVTTALQASPWIPGVSDLPEILRRVDPAIRIFVTPLRLPPYLARADRAFGLTQPEVNAAYQREYERIGPRPNVRWSRPPPLDGTPPHINDNRGRHRITDWTPAPPAPDPGASWPLYRRRPEGTNRAGG
jgi:DNA repair photolyase